MSFLWRVLRPHRKAVVLQESMSGHACIIQYHHQRIIVRLADRHSAGLLIISSNLRVHSVAWESFLCLLSASYLINELGHHLGVQLTRNSFLKPSETTLKFYVITSICNHSFKFLRFRYRHSHLWNCGVPLSYRSTSSHCANPYGHCSSHQLVSSI